MKDVYINSFKTYPKVTIVSHGQFSYQVWAWWVSRIGWRWRFVQKHCLTRFHYIICCELTLKRWALPISGSFWAPLQKKYSQALDKDPSKRGILLYFMQLLDLMIFTMLTWKEAPSIDFATWKIKCTRWSDSQRGKCIKCSRYSDKHLKLKMEKQEFLAIVFMLAWHCSIQWMRYCQWACLAVTKLHRSHPSSSEAVSKNLKICNMFLTIVWAALALNLHWLTSSFFQEAKWKSSLM